MNSFADHVFGRKFEDPERTVRYWGARTIMSRGHLDFVPDRLGYVGPNGERTSREDPDSGAFKTWINDTAIPWIQGVAKHGITQDQVILMKSDDGLYEMTASPQNSYGYLYIGCREVKK